MADALSFLSLNSYLTGDVVFIDNILFYLHHKISFGFLLLGVLFTFFENHFDGSAISCPKEISVTNAFYDKFCWLHATKHPQEAVVNYTGGDGCFGSTTHQDRLYGGGKGDITYYIWLPFVLVLCAGMSKLPRYLWKNMLENGLMENFIKNTKDVDRIVQRILYGKYHKHPDKGIATENGETHIANITNRRKNVEETSFAADISSAERNEGEEERFKSIKTSTENLGIYFRYQCFFMLCEILNIVTIYVSISICHVALGHHFWSYGVSWMSYYFQDQDQVNPFCEMFPTEIYCDVKENTIPGEPGWKGTCILSFNIFNQHYFLFLWFWWVLLIVVSLGCLVVRVLRFALPGFSKFMFEKNMSWRSTSKIRIKHQCLNSSQYFVLDMLARNVDIDVMEDIIHQIEKYPTN